MADRMFEDDKDAANSQRSRQKDCHVENRQTNTLWVQYNRGHSMNRSNALFSMSD